jgi:hypothetical protein
MRSPDAHVENLTYRFDYTKDREDICSFATVAKFRVELHRVVVQSISTAYVEAVLIDCTTTLVRLY